MASVPSVLKPDLKAVVWLVIGAVVVPMVMARLGK